MEFVFGYLAGLLTLINPCILPVLPIVLATALQASPKGPLALAAGLSLSFVVLGVGVSALAHLTGITTELVAQIGAYVMIAFGLVLLIPALGDRFSNATAGFADKADSRLEDIDRGSLVGQFAGGILLGAVWSPCAGPTLNAAIGLALQGESLVWATAIMIVFAMGVSTIVLLLGYGARAAIMRRQALMRKIAQRSRPFMGAVFVAVGLALVFGVHHTIEAWALRNLPTWFNDFSISI